MNKSLSVIALLLLLCSPAFSQTDDLAEEGNAAAQFNLGVIFAQDNNDAEAVKWYRLAAEQGYANAQFNLGFMYDSGRGVPQNDVEAVKWYRLAAEQGYANAQFNLGFMYANGEGVPQSDARAYLWFSMATAQGYEGASENRDIVSERLDVETRNSAQQLASRCFSSGFKDCE